MSHVDTPSPVTHVSLCAGYGGIDLGLHRAIPSLRTIAVSEIEAFACANLVAKMEAGLLDCAPIWTDLKTFPWSDFRDRVDILSGGYPCQPFSAAGKRLGAEDPRHLWPFIADGIALMRPGCCFFENVEGHISLGLPDVIEDLGRLGYRTTWGLFSASEVGAPHQRKRVFILANSSSQRSPAGISEQESRHAREPGEPYHSGHQAGWPSRPGEQQFAWEPPRVVADSKKYGRISQRIAGDMDSEVLPEGSKGHQLAPTIADCGDAGASRLSEPQHGWEPPRVVGNSACWTAEQPGSNQSEKWRGVAAAGEAMGNAPHANRRSRVIAAKAGARADNIWRRRSGESSQRQAQPPLGRNPNGPAHRLDDAQLHVTCDNRTDELRLLGNGVVPAVAERAWRLLVGELMEANT